MLHLLFHLRGRGRELVGDLAWDFFGQWRRYHHLVETIYFDKLRDIQIVLRCRQRDNHLA